MGATTVLAAAGVCRPGPPRPGWVAISDGDIADVGEGSAPRGAHDLGDALLVPGLIDLQANGIGDIDFATAPGSEWARAASELAARGVTAFCPTLVSAPLDSYDEALGRAATARDALDARDGIAMLLGVHLEGPFLGGAPGAHPAELLRPFDTGWMARAIDAHPLIRMVTVAPEADPECEGIRLLVVAGVVVALGHSNATLEQARAATDAGATVVTHLFNGMAPFHHREPGLVGAALDDDRLTPTLIADLVHVHPVALRLVFARKSNVALVSDVVASSEPADAARLPDGTLMGATALLDRAIANVVGLGVPVERAVAAATSIPADLLGLDRHGRIDVGHRADLVALDPHTFTVREVWIRGVRLRHVSSDVAVTHGPI